MKKAYNIGVRRNQPLESPGPFDSFDLEKFISVFRKSLLWVLLILLITNLLAYLYIRYTKPVYESYSDLKLDVQSEAQVFGITDFPNEDTRLNSLSGEIELIRSKLFFTKVIDALSLDVTYYAIGNLLDTERYKNSPFKVNYSTGDEFAYDRKFFLTLTSPNQFRLTYQVAGQELSNEYTFGEEISTEHFSFKIYATEHYSPDLDDRNYYFIIHSQEALINYLSNKLTVAPLNLQANTIRIRFQDYNRFKARDMVNAIDTLYLEYTQEEKNRANQQRIAFLDDQLNQIESKMGRYEDYFENFTIRNKTTDVDKDMARLISMMEQLDSQRVASQNRLQFINNTYDELLEDESVSVELTDLPYIPQDLQNALQEHTQKLREKELLLASYQPNTFTVRKKNQELEILKKEILESLDNLRKYTLEKLQEINRNQRDIESNFVTLPEKSTEYSKNRRNYTLDEERYLLLMEKKAEFQIAKAGTTTDFIILASATLPFDPVYPRKALTLALGMVAGIFLSVLFVGGRYFLHTQISSQTEVERLLKAPLLGSVPQYTLEKIADTRLIVHKHPKSAVSESLRVIRTNLEFLSADRQKKLISVTSTISGEGKTFVAVNLAGIIALSGLKVCILDLDMRRPKVHKAFEDPNGPSGLSTLLIRKQTLDQVIRETPIPTLQYIPSGHTPPNPSELLMSQEFDKLTEALKERYDVIIMDTPPVGLVTDGMLAMKKGDVPIYVLRAEFSRKSFIKTINRLIEINRVENLCVVFNALNIYTDQGYNYGKGYYEESEVLKPNIFKRIFGYIR